MYFYIKLRNFLYNLFKINKFFFTAKSKNILSISIINGLVRSYGVSFDNNENIFIPDMPANNIIKLNKDFKITDVLDVSKKQLINCSYIGKANRKKIDDISLVSPHYVAFDNLGNFYIAEFNAGRISFFKRYVSQKRFYCVKKPVSIFIENERKVYITDYEKNEVILLNPTNEKYKSFINSNEIVKLGLPKIDRPHGFSKGPNGFFICQIHGIIEY